MQVNNTYIKQLVEALESNPLVSVTFHTKSGSVRVMECSKMLLYVPEDQLDGRFNYRLNGPAIACVFDYQNGEWRSFRYDSVVEYKILDWNVDGTYF